MLISEIKLKTSGLVQGKFMVLKHEFKSFTNKSGTFLSCELSDRTGIIKAVMWDNIDSCKSWISNKTIVDVSGELSTYKDIPQIQIKFIAKAEIYNSSDFVSALDSKKIEAFINYLSTIKLTNKVCKSIWEEILKDPMRSKFITCPGGVGEVHHAYIGGLLEHSYSMVVIASELARIDGVDKDILTTGCLVHDIGKIECYNWESAIEMNDFGRLFHHTYTGYNMIMKMAGKLKISETDPTLLKLAHIIVAHHEGEGIKKTLFPEANAVALIDNLTATVNHSLGFSKKDENKEKDSNWTKYCQLTGRQYYIPVDAENINLSAVLNGF